MKYIKFVFNVLINIITAVIVSVLVPFMAFTVNRENEPNYFKNVILGYKEIIRFVKEND